MSSLSIYPPETHGGTVTSWIPVGTAFPSSRGCESLYWSVVPNTLAVWDPGYGLYVDTNVRCVPPAVTTWWNNNALGFNSLTRVSLGPITCPSAYTTATTLIENQSSTFVACCPRNYTFIELRDVGNTGQCSSEVPAGKEITYAIRDEQQSWITTSTSYTTATQAWGVHIDGYNIAPPTTSSSTTSSTSETSSTTGAPPATNTPESPSGLSTGAKAGIGVGAALGALALVALIVFIFVHRKRKSASNLKSENTVVPVHELEGRREADLSELDGRGVPAELAAKR